MRVTGNKKINTYRLSIRVLADGFSLYIYKVGESKPSEHQHVPIAEGESPHSTLERALTRERLTELQYEEVEMVVDAPATRIPLEEFQREEMKALYQLTFPQTKTAQVKICYEILPYLEVVEVFAVDRQLLNMLTALFPEVQLHSSQGRILENAAKGMHRKSLSGKCMFVSRISTGILLYVLKNKGLHFACTYDVVNQSDMLYHVLHAWKELNMNVLEDCCMLQGCDGLLEDLSKYIKNVRTCE